MAQSWSQLSVHARAADIDALANFLMERGAPGVVIKRQGLEAYFAAELDSRALRRDVARFARALAHLSAARSKPQLRWRRIRQESWEHAWKRFIKPRRVGKHFWVTPPWIPAPKFRSRRVITIEPGLAFGTGSHPTTRGCMEFLEWTAEHLPRNFTALDVGTGSGILAIALALLGAGSVRAVDNDPVAIGVARDNLRSNGMEGRIHLGREDLSRVAGSFDVVAANLTAETILELCPELERKTRHGGYLVLSGILHSNCATLRRRLGAGFRVIRQKRSREWLTLLLERA